MLVLGRRLNESIMIGDHIKITVVRIKGSYQVGIGIEAPKDTKVHREEVYQRTRRAKTGEAA